MPKSHSCGPYSTSACPWWERRKRSGPGPQLPWHLHLKFAGEGKPRVCLKMGEEPWTTAYFRWNMANISENHRNWTPFQMNPSGPVVSLRHPEPPTGMDIDVPNGTHGTPAALCGSAGKSGVPILCDFVATISWNPWNPWDLKLPRHRKLQGFRSRWDWTNPMRPTDLGPWTCSRAEREAPPVFGRRTLYPPVIVTGPCWKSTQSFMDDYHIYILLLLLSLLSLLLLLLSFFFLSLLFLLFL